MRKKLLKNLVSSQKVRNFALAFGTEVTSKARKIENDLRNVKNLTTICTIQKFFLTLQTLSVNAKAERKENIERFTIDSSSTRDKGVRNTNRTNIRSLSITTGV